MSSEKPKLFDPFPARGSYESTPIATGLFNLFRFLDIPLQYTLLSTDITAPLFRALGLRETTPGPPAFGGLSSYRLIILAMNVGGVAKQILWASFLSRESILANVAVMVGVANWVTDTANTLLSLWPAASPAGPRESLTLPIYLGAAIYSTGLLLEMVAEVQRKRFKDDARNQGKPYTGGLFGLARHINYGGFTLYRTGYALASGGWAWGAFTFLLFSRDFLKRAIPLLDEYCGKRYGQAWTAYREKVPYRLLPGLL